MHACMHAYVCACVRESAHGSVRTCMRMLGACVRLHGIGHRRAVIDFLGRLGRSHGIGHHSLYKISVCPVVQNQRLSVVDNSSLGPCRHMLENKSSIGPVD